MKKIINFSNTQYKINLINNTVIDLTLIEYHFIYSILYFNHQY